MRYTWFATMLICASFVQDMMAYDRPSAEPSYKVIYEQPIGETGQHFVVTRGPDRDPSLFHFWKNDGGRDSTGHTMVEQMENMYEVRVGLRSPQADPLLLSSRLRVEGGMPQNKGLAVLSVLIDSQSMVLAMAEGPYLAIWRIGEEGSCWTPFKADKLWTPFAAPSQLNEHMVGMTLGRTEDGRLTVEVADKRIGQYTFYEESEKGSLRFKVIREWTEKKQK